MWARIAAILWIFLFLGLVVYRAFVRWHEKDFWFKRLLRWLRDVIELVMGL